jgi:soluble lytic murein transglycosylase-like protein
MSKPLTMRADRGPNARWRPSSSMAGPALAALCLLLLSGGQVALGGQVAAQPDDSEGELSASASILADSEPDPDAPRPLAFKPLAAKPLTPADLPPSNVFSARFPRTASIAFGRDWHAGRDAYRPIIEREALAYGLPPALVDAVMAVESHYNSAVIGNDGEIGLMQVMLPTARMLGFTGTEAELADPSTNIHYGVKYLAGAWRLAGEDLCTATMKYRAGHGETRFSFLSVDYCMRVRDHLAASGVKVTGSVPQPTFGGTSGGVTSGARTRSRPLSGGGTVNLAALNARLKTLTEKIAPRYSR